MRLFSLALSAIILCIFSLRAYGQTEDELIAGAKKEAKVTFWSGMALDDSRLVAAGFEKKYPFIKVDIFRAGGEQIVNRAIEQPSTMSPHPTSSDYGAGIGSGEIFWLLRKTFSGSYCCFSATRRAYLTGL